MGGRSSRKPSRSRGAWSSASSAEGSIDLETGGLVAIGLEARYGPGLSSVYDAGDTVTRRACVVLAALKLRVR